METVPTMPTMPTILLLLLVLQMQCSSAFVNSHLSSKTGHRQKDSFSNTPVRQLQQNKAALHVATTSTTDLQHNSNHNTVSLKWSDFSEQHPPDGSTTTPVLLLHGLLGSKRNFASIARSLSVQLETPRRILGVDLRNHGGEYSADEWCDTMSYEEMASDVIQFLDEQNLNQVILVGHSMGGKVAQAISLLYPQRVTGLVVLDIAPVEYCSEKDPHWKAVEDILHAMQQTTGSDDNSHTAEPARSDVDKQLRSAIPDPALRAFCLTNYGRGGWKIPIHAICNQLDSIRGFSHKAKGQTYQGDAFFIHGGQSRFVRHAYMSTIAEYFPNHMLTTIRGAGHWVHAEAPDDTVALLKRFLDR